MMRKVNPASTYKKRLDLLVVELGLLPDRMVARSAIMDGAILVNGQKCTKPGSMTAGSSVIELIPSWKKAPYASRGGVKLERALQKFEIDVAGRICLDIGASTGGFTDCLLKHGASKIYAIDVGYGQLAWELRQDSRVIVKERINARGLKPEMIYDQGDPRADLAVIDVSFISITKLLEPCLQCLNPASPELICLIKPQFEAGRSLVKPGGVVRSAQTHLAVLQSVISFARQIGCSTLAATYSPLKGPAGNIEFLVHLRAGEPVAEKIDLKAGERDAEQIDLQALVEAAHRELTKKDPGCFRSQGL